MTIHIGPDQITKPQPLAATKSNRQFWTAGEEKILRELYPKGGVPACMPLLIGRRDRAIYSKAYNLGLHKPNWVKDFSYQRYTTSDAIDAVIRRAYERPSRGFVGRLAKVLNRPDWWVCMRAQRLGLVAPRFKEPPWSAEEDEIVGANAHRHPATVIKLLKAAGFKRTGTAITVRLKRLGQPTGKNADIDRYTAGALSRLFGVDGKSVARWIAQGLLKAERRGTQRVAIQGGDEYSIHRRDIRQFVIANPSAIDLRKVEKFWFIELMAGAK